MRIILFKQINSIRRYQIHRASLSVMNIAPQGTGPSSGVCDVSHMYKINPLKCALACPAGEFWPAVLLANAGRRGSLPPCLHVCYGLPSAISYPETAPIHQFRLQLSKINRHSVTMYCMYNMYNKISSQI